MAFFRIFKQGQRRQQAATQHNDAGGLGNLIVGLEVVDADRGWPIDEFELRDAVQRDIDAGAKILWRLLVVDRSDVWRVKVRGAGIAGLYTEHFSKDRGAVGHNGEVGLVYAAVVSGRKGPSGKIS